MRALPITNEYPPEWPEINDRVCEEAGHRCIRCNHPYTKGTHGKGEWSPCDAQCRHHGPLAFVGAEGKIAEIANEGMRSRDAQAIAFGRKGMSVAARWRILTVHHFDGNKANCEWYNLMALCQRCHLTIQARVNPNQPYMFEHSEWAKPYVAGFYAAKYLGEKLTREQVMARLDELLALERIA